MNYHNIDWNDVWTEQMKRHHESGNRKESTSIWEEKESAKRFWEMAQRDNRKRSNDIISSLHIKPESRVLDIGAGPGTLAIPLAEKVKHITAVEPAMGMIEVLEEKIAEYGYSNISIVKKKWEDIDLSHDLDGPYDVIIASFSLSMPDIRKAIEDMQAVSCGYIYLYWFAGDRPWDRYAREIWPKLHGNEYSIMPKCDVLYNVLYLMGIYPHMETSTLGHTEVYPTLDDAMKRLSNHFSIVNDEQKAILEQYFEENLKIEDTGYVHDAGSTRVKMWWNTQEK
ncbi:class I SAM-dependent methyltransferase [Methanolobus sp. WCC5]|uniref:class I SAM-dependent methyltransferase n=1 Tax=Methanolobus sp. WCC5 TaxID=3125785 RepID=UPI003251DCF7